MKKNRLRTILIFSIVFLLFFLNLPITTMATQEELNQEAEERKSYTIESNETEGWPQGPINGAASAILMDANTGAILYSKNIDAEMFPASTTKIMTCLVAIENCDLSELITVNQSAIDANESDGSNMGLIAGDKLTLEEMLYGILINSANEACNAVGEHIAGSQEAFVEMMNAKAKAIGCTNTHFVTTNGLHDVQHYVSAHDMALIAREFFKYDILCRISSTGSYTIPANSYHKEYNLLSHNKLTAGREYAYEYLVGSKTGFTSLSRQTLVSCAEKDGIKLICVIMREESPYQFADTTALFEYGFSNFKKFNVHLQDNSYTITNEAFMDSGIDLFGRTSNLIYLDPSASIIIPETIDFSKVNSNLKYNISKNPKAFATVIYDYNGVYLGSADLIINSEAIRPEGELSGEDISLNNEEQVVINISKFLIFMFILMGCIIFYIIFGGVIKKFIQDQKRIAKIKKSRKETEPKRRPVHHKYKKVQPKEEKSNNTGFSKKRKHHNYHKPERRTLYDADANKPGNRKNK